MPVSLHDIQQAAELLSGNIVRTPLVPASRLSAVLLGCRGLPQAREHAVHRLLQRQGLLRQAQLPHRRESEKPA